MTEVRHGYLWGGTFIEYSNQRADYTYDQGQNGLGRLTSVQFGRNDGLGFAPANPFTYSYVYNQAGRVMTQNLTTSMSNPGYAVPLYLTASYQWDNEGRMTQVAYPAVCWAAPCYPTPPIPVYAMQYDNVGRLNGMTEDLQDGNGPQGVATAGYGPAGQLLNLSYFGVSETRTYNSLLQLTRMTATGLMDMQYNYSATQNNGRITSSNDYVTGENVSYSYDALNRLTGASAGSMWGETYSYDGFGNLTGKTVTQPPAPALGVSYDANNHQAGLTYDANGNQSMDAQGATAYGWDVENRLATSTSQGWPGAETWYSYDPFGRRVMKDVNPDPQGNNGGPGYTGGAWELYFYGITGQKLATVQCTYNGNNPTCSLGGYEVYFGGKLVKAKGNVVVTDRLGSVRYSGGVSHSYFPYGEERTVTPDGTEKFGTYLRDGPGQDYAEQRYYNNGTGRFWSVDPGGMKTADATDPVSLNRYAYAGGDPANRVDPTGEYYALVGTGTCLSGGKDPIPYPCDQYLFAGPFNPVGGGPTHGGAVKTPPVNPQAVAYGFAETDKSLVQQGILTDCKGLAAFAGAMAQLLPSASDFVAAFGVLVSFYEGEQYAGVQWNDNPVTLGGNVGEASGFAAQYQNNYGSSEGPDNSDQGHHFAAFLQWGFAAPALVPIGPSLFEAIQGTLTNQGDINLGQAAMMMGAELAAGALQTTQIADQIRKLLCK